MATFEDTLCTFCDTPIGTQRQSRSHACGCLYHVSCFRANATHSCVRASIGTSVVRTPVAGFKKGWPELRDNMSLESITPGLLGTLGVAADEAFLDKGVNGRRLVRMGLPALKEYAKVGLTAEGMARMGLTARQAMAITTNGDEWRLYFKAPEDLMLRWSVERK